MTPMNEHPLLYSFRRCPYAIRARIALIHADILFTLHEVDLKNKPPALLAVSAKGTVPVLILKDGSVIDESLDILDFVFPKQTQHPCANKLLDDLNRVFIPTLNRFKYADRFEDVDIKEEQARLSEYLDKLNKLLDGQPYLLGEQLSKYDAAILPFVRQLYKADDAWFDGLDCQHVQRWLHDFLDSPLHWQVMKK